MIKVKMHSIYAGPNGSCGADGHIDLPEKEAAELVKGKYASYHEAPKAENPEEKAAETAETADVKTPENASNAPQNRKKQGGNAA